MKIAEIYKSVQGEGLLTGTESVFVRASGCNLRCWFCDTSYSSWKPEGRDLTVNEIFEQVVSHECQHVIVTGGEPMLYAELIPLCTTLKTANRHITIETAGTLYLPLKCDLMSISPKFASSAPTAENEPRWQRRHEQTRHAPRVLRQLLQEHDYQIKFVIDAPEDCNTAEDYLVEFPEIDRHRVFMMPQGTDPKRLSRIGQWLEPYCAEQGLLYCPRKQIEWFGLVRGT